MSPQRPPIPTDWPREAFEPGDLDPAALARGIRVEIGTWDRYHRPVGLSGIRRRAPECSCAIPCLVFWCAACEAWRPWCYGAADDLPDCCDGCWTTFSDHSPANAALLPAA